MKFWGKSALCRVCKKFCKILIGAPQDSVQFDFIHATLVTSLIVLRCDGGKKNLLFPGQSQANFARRRCFCVTTATYDGLHVSRACKSFSEAAPGCFWGGFILLNIRYKQSIAGACKRGGEGQKDESNRQICQSFT